MDPAFHFPSGVSLLLPSLQPISEDPWVSWTITQDQTFFGHYLPAKLCCVLSQKPVWSCTWDLGGLIPTIHSFFPFRKGRYPKEKEPNRKQSTVCIKRYPVYHRMVKIALENMAEAGDVQWGFQLPRPESVHLVFSDGEAEVEDRGGRPGLTQGHSPARLEISNIIWEVRPAYGTKQLKERKQKKRPWSWPWRHSYPLQMRPPLELHYLMWEPLATCGHWTFVNVASLKWGVP